MQFYASLFAVVHVSMRVIIPKRVTIIFSFSKRFEINRNIIKLKCLPGFDTCRPSCRASREPFVTNDSIGHKVISLNQSKESFVEGLSKLGLDILPCKTLGVFFYFFFIGWP